MAATPEVKRLRDLKSGVRDLIMLDPRIIVIEEGHNPRNYQLPENRSHLDALKVSIKQNGTLVPLLVRYEPSLRQAILVDGECRLRANLELIAEGEEIDAVQCTQVDGKNVADRLVLSLSANTGKPLSEWELGSAFKRFINFGWELPKIAERTGYRQAYISRALELADAPDDVKQLLSEQAVTPALALRHLRRDGSLAGATLAAEFEKAREQGLTKARATRTPAQAATLVKITQDQAKAWRTALRSIRELVENVQTTPTAGTLDAIFQLIPDDITG